MITGTPAARSGRAMSSARGYWFDCTPTSPTKPNSSLARISAMILSTRTRVLVSSIAALSSVPAPPRAVREDPVHPRVRVGLAVPVDQAGPAPPAVWGGGGGAALATRGIDETNTRV